MYSLALLDTDILSELFKGHNLVKEKVSGYLKEHKQLTISHITRYEILKGLKAKGAEKQIEAFNAFCRYNVVLPINDDAIVKAADIYASLKSQGNLISDADIFVAAIAVSNNLVLVTNNTSHFTRVEGLRVENWKA